MFIAERGHPKGCSFSMSEKCPKHVCYMSFITGFFVVILFHRRQTMWIEFNNNPCKRVVDDCAVRALSVALGIDWEEAYMILADAGFEMCDMPNSKTVLSAVLRKHKFYLETIPNMCPACYTASDFCRDNPVGTYVLGFNSHIATVKNGDIYDSWDSSHEIPLQFWTR